MMKESYALTDELQREAGEQLFMYVYFSSAHDHGLKSTQSHTLYRKKAMVELKP